MSLGININFNRLISFIMLMLWFYQVYAGASIEDKTYTMVLYLIFYLKDKLSKLEK